MLSTALELSGFAAIAAASCLAGGIIALLFVVGAELLFLGYATDGVELVAQARKRRRGG